MKKLPEMTINDFLNELASDSPAPGGGSVAALAGALGAALTSMVCNLTVGKEKYARVQDDIKVALQQSETLRHQLTALIDEDTKAFNEVMKAVKMPKETEDQKEKRRQALQQAYTRAAQVPLTTAETCEKVLDIAMVVAEKGNKNSITDAAVSALLAHSGVESAILNVKINLSAITDGAFIQLVSTKIENLRRSATEKTNNILNIVSAAL